MPPRSSSTSSSEPSDGGSGPSPGGTGAPASRPGGGGGGGLREAVIVALWTVLFLAAGDVAINVLFPIPADRRAVPTGQLRTYFNYGWTIEAKIRRAVGPTDETSEPLMLAGWIDGEVQREASNPRARDIKPGDLVVSSYGMSFSNHVAQAMAELDPRIRLRLFGGPSAPPNHSYATYQLDRGARSQVVMLGILGSSVSGLLTNNGMVSRFEGPAPFTYPIYVLRDAGLQAQWPLVRSLDDLRSRLKDPAGWEAYVAQLRDTDVYYNGFLFRHDLTDYSALVRMVRRAVAQRWQAAQSRRIHGPDGFTPEGPVVPTLQAIVSAFAAGARRDGKLPVVLLLHDQGYRDHIHRVLEPVLTRDRIPYVSTHTICPDTDVRNFAADGHFTPDANRKIARAVLALIGDQRGPRDPRDSSAAPRRRETIGRGQAKYMAADQTQR